MGSTKCASHDGDYRGLRRYIIMFHKWSIDVQNLFPIQTQRNMKSSARDFHEFKKQLVTVRTRFEDALMTDKVTWRSIARHAAIVSAWCGVDMTSTEDIMELIRQKMNRRGFRHNVLRLYEVIEAKKIEFSIIRPSDDFISFCRLAPELAITQFHAYVDKHARGEFVAADCEGICANPFATTVSCSHLRGLGCLVEEYGVLKLLLRNESLLEFVDSIERTLSSIFGCANVTIDVVAKFLKSQVHDVDDLNVVDDDDIHDEPCKSCFVDQHCI